MTYNSKKNTVLLVGPSGYKKIFEYNADTMTKTKEYAVSSVSAIGYDVNTDMYVGKMGIRFMMADSTNIARKYAWDVMGFETSQGGESYEGYWFYVTSDLGVGTYQTKSFYGGKSNIVQVYNIKFKNGVPTKDFGRLVCRLYMTGKGELESVSFQGGNIVFGFATQSIDKTYTYTFYKINYTTFKDFVKSQAKIQGSNYME